MKRLLMVALLVVGCRAGGGESSASPSIRADAYEISVYHDSLRSATCWIYQGRGISCLPDSQLAK